jgi:hypothetical protein
MRAWEVIAEQKIREAIERGEFDNLEGRGKPLRIEDDRGVPEDLRLAYKILKNAGCVPPEIDLKREITRLDDLVANMEDERERCLQLKRLNWMVTKLNMLRSRPVNFEEQERYHSKLCDKLSTASRKKQGGGR